jgi:CRP-like cAMP-binding protein
VVPSHIVSCSFGQVDSGLLGVVESDSYGRDAVTELIGPGGTIGELNLLEAGTGPLGRIEALLPSRVRWFGAPEGGFVDQSALNRAVFGVVAAKVRQAVDAGFRRRLQSLSQQAAQVLLDVSRATDGWCLLRQRDLARIIGTHRSSLNQACRDLQRRGWIVIDDGIIQVLAPEALAAYADAGVVAPPRSLVSDPLDQRLAQAQAVLVRLVLQGSMLERSPAQGARLRAEYLPKSPAAGQTTLV